MNVKLKQNRAKCLDEEERDDPLLEEDQATPIITVSHNSKSCLLKVFCVELFSDCIVNFCSFLWKRRLLKSAFSAVVSVATCTQFCFVHFCTCASPRTYVIISSSEKGSILSLELLAILFVLWKFITNWLRLDIIHSLIKKVMTMLFLLKIPVHFIVQ